MITLGGGPATSEPSSRSGSTTISMVSFTEMEKKVESMMNLIEQDGDSFAKRAELYFQRRPELSNIVQEMYKSYTVLADRYDRISGELHKANHTIAIAFPDQVELVMHNDEDDSSPKAITSIDPSKFPVPIEAPQCSSTVKAKDNSEPKKTHCKRITSQVCEEKAQEEIERVQQEIEEEYAKSCYDSILTRYLAIERKLSEMQEEFCSLQDAVSANSIIEDNETRALMITNTIKSCEDSLLNLKEIYKVTSKESRIELKRVQVAKQKLKALRGECSESEMETIDTADKNMELNSTTDFKDSVLKEERLEIQSMRQRVEEHFEMSSEASIMELAEKIDELIAKVVSLELTVSSQNAQISKLTSETDELQGHLRSLEEDRVIEIGDPNSLTEKLNEAEDKLQSIRHHERCLQEDEDIFQTQFTEACHSLNYLCENLQSPKCLENADIIVSAHEGETLVSNKVSLEEGKEEDYAKIQSAVGDLDEDIKQDSASTKNDSHVDEFLPQLEEIDGNPNLESLSLKGLECGQKGILAEYTSILNNYKDTRERLLVIEKQSEENHLETMKQVKELKNVNAQKDEKIQVLKEMLNSLHAHIDVNVSEDMDNSRYQVAENVAKKEEKFHVLETGSQHDEDIKLCHVNEIQTSSAIEDKFREQIDSLLEENLDFWLRFCTLYHQIQQFQTRYRDLKFDIENLNKMISQEGNAAAVAAAKVIRNEANTVQKSLRELINELRIWLEKNALLYGELRCRFSSLCSIEDEISRVTKASEAEDVHFTPYQAAKFQGEVLNMKLENTKVAKELKSSLDFVRELQEEIGRTLSKFNDNFKLPGLRRHSHHNHRWHLSSKTRLPLRNFLFGSKAKKPSVFSCMNPALQKQYSDLRYAFPR
ncbi:hypothetical protein Cni_G27460 [Canna indica]|uniref:NAB domain-containing protein n=1 Tax=Canna indica TaxID=4628 RepID=A0AAQ3L0T8_9LILI|nr:hypothetical protein Cni_G27460 [Canna indica]